MTRLSHDDVQRILSSVKSLPSEQLESETIEFKGYANTKALHNAKELAEELSALANREGGAVIVGVKDDNDVPHDHWEQQLQGISDSDPLEIKERLAGKLKPSVQLYIWNISFEGKVYLVIEIEKGFDSLVSTASGKTCIREGRSSRPMLPDEVERSVKSLAHYDWSNDYPSDKSSGQLDAQAVDAALRDFTYRRKMNIPPSVDSYLEAVGATQNGHLTRGGLMFLGTEEAIRTELGVYEFRFSWKKRNGELVTNDIWSGNLWNTIVRAEEHFKRCNSIQSFRTHNAEFEAPLMDEIAFHEAFLNALVHRDYSVDGMTSVTFSGDLLRIHSPGTFFGGVTSDNIARHEPRHRNKNLAKILMSHHFVDRAGMGVLRMGLGSLRYGRAFPEFHEQSDAVEVQFEARHLRPAIAILGIKHKDDWGIPELLVLNSVYEIGVVALSILESRLEKLVDAPFEEIKRVTSELPQVEICGTKEGVFVRVVPTWKTFM